MRTFLQLGLAVTCCLALSAAALAATAGATAATGDHWYISKGSSCVSRPGQAGPFARASVLMYSDDFPSTNVQAFKLSARLIPTTAGLNISRPWTNFSQKLTLTGAHKLLMTVYAPIPDLEKGWNLQIHVTWDRMSSRDWHNQLTVKNFNTARCPASASGGLPDPVQALPNSG
jgi:hypothetical protein